MHYGARLNAECQPKRVCTVTVVDAKSNISDAYETPSPRIVQSGPCCVPGYGGHVRQTPHVCVNTCYFSSDASQVERTFGQSTRESFAKYPPPSFREQPAIVYQMRR